MLHLALDRFPATRLASLSARFVWFRNVEDLSAKVNPELLRDSRHAAGVKQCKVQILKARSRQPSHNGGSPAEAEYAIRPLSRGGDARIGNGVLGNSSEVHFTSCGRKR